MTSNLARFIAALPCGFLTDREMPRLIELDRLALVLVRCGGCRFLCSAQYVGIMENYVRAGGDYLRDVSIPANDCEEARKIVAAERTVEAAHQAFDERDCSGAFDGICVTSDADPGL